MYIATSSPTALAWQDKQLIGHGKSCHHHGFSSPIGKLKNINTSLEKMRIENLAKIGVFPAEKAKLEFESGVLVEGVLSNIHRNRYGLNMIMTFNDCTVTYNGEVLFDPSWGVYDMAVGEKIVSVFSGPADIFAFDDEPYVAKETTHKIEYSTERLRLHELYQQVRDARSKNNMTKIPAIWEELKGQFAGDWLCALEILEIVQDEDIRKEVKTFLQNKSVTEKEYSKLITDGLELIA